MVIATIGTAGFLGSLRLNLTPSEPLGLWRIEPLTRPVVVGDLVFVCPPPGSIVNLGLERGYFRQGLCPGGVAPLIKTVAALAGADITIGAAVVANGHPLPSSRLALADSAGRPLAAWSGGRVPPGHLFLHSPFRGSYDSRYFGPVPEGGILGLARPVVTIDP